eukprot:scaffold1789_cov375-Prasinococcus_capsulatus_cf.AAC.16
MASVERPRKGGEPVSSMNMTTPALQTSAAGPYRLSSTCNKPIVIFGAHVQRQSAKRSLDCRLPVTTC